MTEFWELCNAESRARLIQYHWGEHGCYPDWYLKEKQPVTMSPEVEEEYLDDVAKFMSQAPSRSRD